RDAHAVTADRAAAHPGGAVVAGLDDARRRAAVTVGRVAVVARLARRARAVAAHFFDARLTRRLTQVAGLDLAGARATVVVGRVAVVAQLAELAHAIAAHRELDAGRAGLRTRPA